MVQNPFADGLSVRLDAQTDSFQQGISSAISRLGDMKLAVAGAGAALAALSAGGIYKATQSAAEFEAQLADLEKVTSAEMVAPLREGIMGLAEEIPMAREGLVELATQAGKFGAETEEEIMGFVESVGKIASATDLAADEAGQRFAKIAGAVGMPMDEIGKLGNAVNSLADSMKTDANEITDTATRAANTLSQQMGLGADAVLAMSASMNEVSSSSRLAASSLRRVGETLMDPKKATDIAEALGMTTEEFQEMRDEEPQELINTVAEAMAENGDTAEDLRGIMGKAATDFSKLGTQMESTARAQDTANQQFEDGTSLQREMSIRTDTAAGKWQLLQNRIQNAATRIGEQFLPVAKAMLDQLMRLMDILGRVNQKTEGMAGAVVLVAGLVSGLVVAVGGLVGALGASAIAMGAASTAAAALGATLSILLGPVGLVALAIAGLAVAWKKNLFDIQGKTEAVVNYIQDEVIAPFLSWFGPIWDEHFAAVAASVTETAAVWRDALSGFVEWAKPYVGGFLDFIDSIWSVFGGDIMAYTEFVFDALKGTVEWALDAITTSIQVTLALLRGDWRAAWGYLSDFAEDTLDGLLGFVSRWGGRLKRRLTGLIRGAGRAAARAFKNAFNAAIPSRVSIPSVTIAGQRVGGGGIPLPQLASGGFIEEGGLAQLHAGERVVPAAQVTDRGEQTITVEQPDAGGQERLLQRIADAVEGGGDATIELDGRVLGEVVEDVQDDRASLEVTR